MTLLGVWPEYLKRLLPRKNSAPMKEHEQDGSACHFTAAEKPPLLHRDLILDTVACALVDKKLAMRTDEPARLCRS